jgi:hypothetical protein
MPAIFLLVSCSGYIAQKYKVIYGTQNIYHGSRIQMLIEDVDSIETLVARTGQSFNLKKISISEARRKYFWLDPGVNIIFAYSNPISDEFYNLIILYEEESQRRFRDFEIPQYTYWIEFFNYSKYGTETEELIALRDEFIGNFQYKYGVGSILNAAEATPPKPPVISPRPYSLKDISTTTWEKHSDLNSAGLSDWNF